MDSDPHTGFPGALLSRVNRRKPLVLIVDSEERTRDLYGNWFWSIGFDVMTAGFQEVAHRLARRDQPALLLTDLHVRGSIVLPLIQKLQDDSETRDIPILVVTRSTETFLVQAAKQAGAAVVLPKLVGFDVLLASVLPLVSLRFAIRDGHPAPC